MTVKNLELFNQAIKTVLAHEGGYTHNENDPGGETNFGISTRFLRDNNITVSVKLLTKEEAIFIYKKYFWDKYNFALLTQEPISTKLFDTAINIGPQTAIKMAQNILQHHNVNIADDGIIGPRTASALNSVKPLAFLQDYRQLQKEHYQKLIAKNEKLKVFEKGWLRRAAS